MVLETKNWIVGVLSVAWWLLVDKLNKKIWSRAEIDGLSITLGRLLFQLEPQFPHQCLRKIKTIQRIMGITPDRLSVSKSRVMCFLNTKFFSAEHDQNIWKNAGNIFKASIIWLIRKTNLKRKRDPRVVIRKKVGFPADGGWGRG